MLIRKTTQGKCTLQVIGLVRYEKVMVLGVCSDAMIDAYPTNVGLVKGKMKDNLYQVTIMLVRGIGILNLQGSIGRKIRQSRREI